MLDRHYLNDSIIIAINRSTDPFNSALLINVRMKKTKKRTNLTAQKLMLHNECFQMQINKTQCFEIRILTFVASWSGFPCFSVRGDLPLST